jgi:hypothetical protein
MSPEKVTSEWMQPIRPMRVLFKTSEENRHHVYIFAIRTIGEQMEYLSIDGIFISALSRSVNHAETLIENNWTRLG